MINGQNNLETLYRFLLEDLAPAESERMEIRLLEDAELQELVEAAEFDLIDEYLRGELSVADADRFESHFLNSPARRQKLDLARIFPGPDNQKAETPDNVIPFDSRRKPSATFFPKAIRHPALRIAAGLLCTLGLATVLWQVVWPAWQLNQGMTLLNDAYRKGRPIEARLSGFDHAAWEKDRGPGDERTDPLLRDQGALTLLSVAGAHPGAKTYRALGSSYLLKREFELAIEQFEKSLQFDPNNALTHNDLGAALMESSQSKQQQLLREKDKTTPAAEQLSSEIFLDLSLANEHFSQALQLDAKLKDAVFNQAICLERLGLLDPALRNWEKYLELDPGGGWREEAQERIEALKKQKQKVTFDKDRIFREFLAACESGVEDDIWQAFLTGSQMRGNFITERLLDEYLELLRQGNRAEALKKLDLLTAAGRIEAEKSGDFYTRDLAAYYRFISPRQVALLSSARRAYKEAINRSRKSRQEGLALCRQASEQFGQAGSKIDRTSTDLTAGVLFTRSSEYASATQIAEQAAKYAEGKNYIYLSARALHLMADLHYSQNALTQGIKYSALALKAVDRRKDESLRVVALGFLAYAYWFLDFQDRSLSYALQALKVSRLRPIEPDTLWVAYRQAADSLNAVAHLNTSLTFEKEALQQAILMDRPLLISRSYGFLSDTLVKLNRYTDAIDVANKDLAIGNDHIGDPMGQDIKAHALLRLGHLFRETGKLTESRQSYDECIRISESRGIHHERLDAYRGRLLLYTKNRDYASAQAELEKAIGLFEQNRGKIVEDDLKTSFFETGYDIYNLGIELAVASNNDYWLAFLYSEQGRARSLRDLLQSPTGHLPKAHIQASAGSSLNSLPIRTQMPETAQIVQYSCFNNSLFAWVISNANFFGYRENVQAIDLSRKVNEYLECIRDPGRDQRATILAKELYNILIKPLESQLDPNKEVFIVADKPFHQLPFAALIEPATGKYLFEKYIISYSPSTEAFLHCTTAAKERPLSSAERCLSIGQSTFRQSGLQNSSLPSTRKEAEEVALHYGDSAELLLDEAATEPAVRRLMKTVEVIHIATHGLVNERRLDYSGLALWEEAEIAALEADGMLYSWEINRLKLPRVRMVVLSACQTLIGRDYRGEGMTGIARAFLVAGSPLVVASFWKVDSQATAKFMDRFHALRTQSGLTTARALRETQREMLKNGSAAHRRPFAWAGFVPLGGYAQY